MSKLLVLYDFNSYYNRKIFRLSSFQEYQNLITPQGNNPAQYRGFIRENMNFDFQDGVSASHVINIYKTDPQYMKTEHPNYCVLEETYTEGSGESATTTKKVTRWFILDVVKVRGNQWQYALKRDVLADFYDNVMEAPVFIERGNIMDSDNPLIFNKEGMTFNQIKKAEYLLTNTKLSGKGQGWIVGYLAREETPTDIGPCVAETVAPSEAGTPLASLPQELQDAITAGYFDLYQTDDINVNFYGLTESSNADRRGAVVTVTSNRTSNLYFPYPSTYNDYKGSKIKVLSGATNANTAPDFITYGYDAYFGNIVNRVKAIAAADPNYNPTTTDWRTQYQGIIVEANGKYYELQITADSNVSYSKEYSLSTSQSQEPALLTYIYAYLIDVANGSSHIELRDPTAVEMTSRMYKINIPATRYKVELVEKDFGSTTVTLAKERNPNYEAPYDIFCIPYGNVGVKNNGVLQFTTLNNIALSVARAIAVKGTPSKVYDIQILPYCPFAEILNDDGDIEISGFTVHYDYDIITKTIGGQTNNVGIVIYPKEAQGTFDINISNTDAVYNRCLEVVNDPLGKKIAAETTFARFVSPNFSSIFEINIQKNKGILDLNVDYFLKPYSPYIHVAPFFKGLYGEDFNDPKGLVCAGDFSIATASSQWEQYQVQNKNYEQIFNRQIQNIDVNNSIALRQAKAQAWTGGGAQTMAGIGAGGLTGSIIGTAVAPGAGTIAGGVIGAVAGGLSTGGMASLGAYFDIKYLKESQREARSMFNDMYVYQLGNIQALPYSLTRVSAFTPNNKIFPFIEFYDCTDYEKQALRNKLIYNGASVGVIGKIRDFLGNENYVSGELIRLEGLEEDSQVITEIAEEIKEGAYYYGNTI